MQYFEGKCKEYWEEQPEMRVDFDNIPSTIPDYSGYEQYIQF